MAQIFISYAREDFKQVSELRQRLKDEGFITWMDKVDLLAGQRWRPAIEQAVRESDFFVLCLSNRTVSKRSFVQREIKMALDLWQEMLGDDIFLIPVLLEHIEPSEIPVSIREIGWVFLFEEDGWSDLMRALKHGIKQRAIEAVEERKQEEDAVRQATAEAARMERDAAEQRRRQETARLQKEEAARLKKEKESEQLVPIRKTDRRPVVAATTILLAGLLGYWVWKASQSPQSSEAQKQAILTSTSSPITTPQPSPVSIAQPVVVLRYTQKFESNGNFRLLFTPQRSGYLYLVALDDANKPITLLTNRHAYDTRARANRLTAGTEFTFPTGTPLSLGAGKSSAPVTLIFSPVELKEPTFLNASALHELTDAEQRVLNDLKHRAQAGSLKTEGELLMTIPGENKPMAFEIVLRKMVKGS